MFQNIDKEKMEMMMEQNPEYRKVITQLLENHRLSISSISHEIRNPLALVYSSLQLIQAQHPEVSEFNHWNTMIEDVNFMIDLTNEIGALNNSNHMNFENISMKAVLEDAVLSFAMSLDDSGIELTGNIDSNIHNVVGDKVKIQEVILNLFTNAKQAILSQDKETLKKKPGQIHIHAFNSAGGVTVRIKDNGCGIEQEQMNSIFEPFYTSKQEGTGLGLSICKRIVEAHHGSLTCNSVVGEGSIFELVI